MATSPRAARAKASRRVTPDRSRSDSRFPWRFPGQPMYLSVRSAPLLEPCPEGRTNLARRKHSSASLSVWLRPLRALQGDVLVGGGVGEARDPAEPRLADSRSDAVDKSELPDRREDRPLINQLLHPVQDRLALLVVQLHRLLLVERVDIRVAAIDKRAALDDVGLEPGRGVAEGSGTGQYDIFEGLFRVSLDKGGALDRPQLHPDADRLKVVEHRFADVRVGRVAEKLAAIETLREACFSEELLGLLRIVDRRRRLPEEFVVVGDDRVAGDQGITERHGLVDPVAVDRQASGPPHLLFMPRRFRVPLVGEVYVEHALDDRRLQGQPRCLLQFFGELTADRIDDVDLAALQGREPRGLVGDHLEDQVLYIRRLAPILVEGFEDQLDTRRERHELVRPGADRRFLEPFVADLLDISLRHDPARS